MKGGYRVAYDPREAIAKLSESPLSQEAWDELWNELHHQGDVGEASYAAVPLLVEACSDGPRDWNLYALVATIEVERHRKTNPNVPPWAAESYGAALQRARQLALTDLASASDALIVRSAASVVALASGARELGALLAHIDSSEIRDLLEEQMAWSELYRQGVG
jgi:hypothetical protein